MDFLNWLGSDMSIKILTCLDDPADLVRITSVSRSWHHFVIANGLFKQLCLRIFPQLSRVAYVTELNKHGAEITMEAGCSYSEQWEALERDHRVYSSISGASSLLTPKDCIVEAISASSTDNYPEESIDNTLEPRDMVARRASYWSSKGQSNPDVPETLIYKLVSDFCVINEISVQPFQAFFQLGLPIYSAKAVRFRMGHPKNCKDVNADLLGNYSSTDEKFRWTYTSQQFPMAQENRLQKFKLPEPVLCIGGFLQIELLGRVQRQEMDGLFYICVSHVKVAGRSLSPAFDVDILDSCGKFVLKNDSLVKFHPVPRSPDNLAEAISTEYLQRRVRDLQQIMNIFHGNVEEEDEWDDDDYRGDDGFVEDYVL